MRNPKKRIEYRSIQRVRRAFVFITGVLILAAFFAAFLLYLHNHPPQENYLYAIVFFSLIIAIIVIQFLQRQLCNSLSRTFNSILQDLPQKHVQPILKHTSICDTVSAISNTKLDYSNHTMTTKYLLAEAELNALQDQINPHFLYNTLESICGLALLQGAPEVAKMTETLAHMFRNSLRKTGMLVTLEEEISSIDNYMTIQQFRFSNKFSFYKHIAKEDEKRILSCILPHFTLQPIVENAIYHGLEMVQGKGEIHLHAVLTQKRLLLKVSDNGCGIPHQKLNLINDSLSNALEYTSSSKHDGHVGLAMLNINLRIKKTFGNEYGVSMYSTTGIGTDVNIVLPCTWEKNFEPAPGQNEG